MPLPGGGSVQQGFQYGSLGPEGAASPEAASGEAALESDDDEGTSSDDLSPPYRSPLRVAQSVTRPPWESFMYHSVSGLAFGVALPWAAHLLVMTWEMLQQEVIGKGSGPAKGKPPCPEFWPPYGILLSSFLAFAFFLCRWWTSPSLRYTFSLLPKLLPLCLRQTVAVPTDCRSVSKARRATGQGKRCCYSTLLSCLFALLPLLAFTGNSLWDNALARDLQICRQWCKQADTGLQSLCRRARLDELPPCHAKLPDLKRANISKSGEFCVDILQVGPTSYTEWLLKHDKIFLAFESRLKTQKEIGTLEVYNAPLAVSFFILMLSTRIALLTQRAAVLRAKRSRIKANFCSRQQTEYGRLFRRLRQITGDVALAETTVLEQSREACNEELEREDYLEKDAEAHNCRHFFSWRAPLAFSLGHVLILGCYRVTPWLGDSRQPFFSSEELALPLKVNIAVSFVFHTLWFGFFVAEVHRYEARLQLAIAFDCLWRFPRECPMETTDREDGSSVLSVLAGSDSEGGEGDGFFCSDGYRARFDSDDYQKQIGKLNEWFYIRDYLLLDAAIVHANFQLALVVSVATLLPEVSSIAGNVLMFGKSEGKTQPMTFLTLWDFALISYFVVKGLLVTVKLNGWHCQHVTSLDKLSEHVRRREVGQILTEGSHLSNAGKGGAEAVEGSAKIIKAIEATRDASTHPNYNILGVVLTWKVVTGYMSTIVLMSLPDLLHMMRAISNGKDA